MGSSDLAWYFVTYSSMQGQWIAFTSAYRSGSSQKLRHPQASSVGGVDGQVSRQRLFTTPEVPGEPHLTKFRPVGDDPFRRGCSSLLTEVVRRCVPERVVLPERLDRLQE
jgi:hypothetical protein